MLLPLAAMAVAACGSSSTAAGSGTITPPPDSALFTAGTLTFGSDVSYPPQEYFDPAGSTNATGFDIDLGKALAAKMGLKFVAVNQAFNGIIPALDAKKYDAIISAMTINSDRTPKVDFVPYFVAGESFVVKQGSSYKPTKLEDLCGHKIAVEDGTAEKDEANGLNDAGKPCASNKVVVQVFTVDTEALAQIKKGAVDAHFTDSPVAGYEVKRDSSLSISGSAIEVAPEGIAVRKGDSAIFNPLKAAFKALQDDGTYKSLLQKWGVADGDIANNKS
ncbi:MAG TPA: ABC transporter substrate-binding protein [Candidatus Solibacter sp.]|nr:ABC transporter substrate-binding protein [Candidatus Solibacter sp.]